MQLSSAEALSAYKFIIYSKIFMECSRFIALVVLLSFVKNLWIAQYGIVEWRVEHKQY